MSENKDIILDSFGRVHDYLRISLTERCNLRCFYCMPEEGIQLRNKSEFMRTEEVLEIAKVFVSLGVTKIRLTGGEPLVRKDASNVIRQLGQLPVDLAISSNGILIDKHLNDLLDASVKNVNISLDTLNSERMKKITFRDYFDKIMSNIHLLVQNRFHLKLNMVCIKGVNDDEIKEFILLTKELPITIRFIEYMPFQGNGWNRDQTVSLQEILNTIYSNFGIENVIKLPAKYGDTSKNFKINGFEGNFGIISTISNPFCDTCNRIRLTADGKIKNCLFSSDETDLLSALRNGQDIVPLIFQSIQIKKKEKAGIHSFEGKEDFEIFSKNRNMTSIGG